MRLDGREIDWWKGGIIYQIYPRSFQDTTGDGIGDLPGIRQRLPYVASLGVDAVWISPFFTSLMKDFGYDVSDYRGIDPLFGDMEDFDALIARAHELGFKVMIDLVMSHSSDQHPGFAESRASRDNPRADWYVWADPKPDGTAPTDWLSIFGGPAWQWDARREQYYLHNFLASQPDLNFHNPEVQDELLEMARFWLDRSVDGFRLDTVNFYFLPHAHLRRTVAGPEADAQSMLHHYRWATGLRRKHSALRGGTRTDIHAEGPILTFRRADSQQSLQIRANLSAEEAGGLRP
jgi:alpha-glucosidase